VGFIVSERVESEMDGAAAGSAGRLLAADEPPPFAISGEHGQSPFVIVCDHAGRLVPRALGTLGVSAQDIERHIAWDIGAGAVSVRLGASLDAFVIRQRYSRLVIDCNRRPDAFDSIVPQSEATPIPGNHAVPPDEARRRAQAIFEPYHARIRGELDRRHRAGRDAVLVAIHSFTPVFLGAARPWHAGILFNRDARLGEALLELLRREPNLVVGRNEPYAASEASDYSIIEHGERRGIPHVEIEIRQDLVADDAGQRIWADRFAWLLPLAVRSLPNRPAAEGT
jgi:predicted N-formylglutamate amidohydrolase